LLVVLSLICLGSWANFFKLTGKRWRFELFYLDFAIGAAALAIIAAYTLGSSSELAFSDRMLVAGRTAQAWVGLGGVVFNFGNMLLVAGVWLLGMSFAFPLAAATALVIWCCFHIRANDAVLLTLAILLFILAVVLAGFAASAVRRAKEPSPQRGRATHGMRRPIKGLIAAIFGGVAIGLSAPIASNGTDPEYGVGAYGSVFLFGIGVFISTIIFGIYFMNVSIEGPSARAKDYFRGKKRTHVCGLVAGFIFIVGVLCAALANAAPDTAGVNAGVLFAVPLASVILAFLWGISAWQELCALSGKGKALLCCGVLAFSGGLAAVALGLA
jgi:glucose uptake protein